MDSNINVIQPKVYIVNNDVLINAVDQTYGINLVVECAAKKLEVDAFTLTAQNGDCNYTLPDGTQISAPTDFADGTISVYRLKDPARGNIWVDKTDYDTMILTCNDCCG